jgi:hypothetical protein
MDLSDDAEGDERLDELDRGALQACLDPMLVDPEHAEHFAELLRKRSWFDVALTACYECQITSLRLMPWMTPPCYISNEEAERIIANGPRWLG